MADGEPEVRFAVVNGSKRRRSRVSAGCVRVLDDAAAARDASDPDAGCFAARVLGPSRSAEGQLMYYLLEWLD
jgi:hypothetical protein